MPNPFRYAQGKRVELVNYQKQQIKKIYREVSDEVNKDLKNLEKRQNISIIDRVYLHKLQSEIGGYLTQADMKVESTIKNNMGFMVDYVSDNNVSYLSGLGFLNTAQITSSPQFKQNVVERIISGKIYDGKWSLSKAIWGDNQSKISEINSIVAKGILKNKSAYDIAKDLQRYVNPLARKDYSWSNVYPGSRKVIDYNAQRLARTMVSHAYQQAFVELTKNNPFIEAYQWITSGGDRVCPLCIERAEEDRYGLGPGVFPKDELPIDHPNGMCTFDVVVTMSDDEIKECIADWYLGEGDEDMNESIEYFLENL